MFARLNGWPLLVRDGSGTGALAAWGEMTSPSFNGAPFRARRALPASVTLETSFTEQEDADTLEALLEGQGHRFPLDFDAHSEGGLGPQGPAATDWAIVTRIPGNGGTGVFGAAYLDVSTSIVWDAQVPDDRWTVLLWRNVDSTPAHLIVRSDGAKWLNGVRADGTGSTELVVDSGAVSLLAGAYDDVVILPFVASAGFLEAFYRWSIERGLVFAAPFDDATARDVVGLADGVVTGGSVVRLGARGAYVGSALTDGIEYATARAAAFGLSELSFEMIFTPETRQNTALAWHKDGTDGWAVFQSATSPTGRVGVELTVGTAGGDALLSSPNNRLNTVPLNARAHLVMTWKASTGVIVGYLNGRSIDREAGSFTDQIGQAASDDSAGSLFIGNTSFMNNGHDGRIEEPRFYERALTAAEVRERYLAVLAGEPGGLPRPFSALPALDLAGELAARPTVQVKAVPHEQGVVQHGQRPGGSAGWKNNSRNIAFDLDEQQALDVETLPAPLWAFTLAERFLDGTDLRPAFGGVPAATLGGVGVFGPGPFTRGRARRFFSDPLDRFDLAADLVSALYGLRAATVLAWVLVEASGTERGVVNLSTAAGAGGTRLNLAVGAGDTVIVRGRGESGDALVTRTSGGVIPSFSPFHLIGGYLDVAGDRSGVFLDDAGLASVPRGFYEEGASTFTSTRFSSEGDATESAIGTSVELTLGMAGSIAHVAVYPGILLRADVQRIWAAGRRGILR